MKTHRSLAHVRVAAIVVASLVGLVACSSSKTEKSATSRESALMYWPGPESCPVFEQDSNMGEPTYEECFTWCRDMCGSYNSSVYPDTADYFVCDCRPH